MALHTKKHRRAWLQRIRAGLTWPPLPLPLPADAVDAAAASSEVSKTSLWAMSSCTREPNRQAGQVSTRSEVYLHFAALGSNMFRLPTRGEN